MSITIGIYDLFAYTIPGLLYLYTIYCFFYRIGVITFGFSDIPDLSSGMGLFTVIILVIASHIVGHLFDFFTLSFTARLSRRYETFDSGLQHIKKKYPDINIEFQPRNWSLLFTMLRKRNHEFTRIIDSYGANSIMMRNISFGLFLLSLIKIYELILNFSVTSLIIVLGLLLFCFISYRRSRMFHRWFFTHIFEASLDYGSSLKEVVAYGKNTSSTSLTKPAPKPRSKLKPSRQR